MGYTYDFVSNNGKELFGGNSSKLGWHWYDRNGKMADALNPDRYKELPRRGYRTHTYVGW